GSGNSVKLSVPGQSSVQWSSADTSIATVDGEGNVTGVSGGWVTITANYSGQTSHKELRVVPNSFTPRFYAKYVNSGKKDWDGWTIGELTDDLTNVTMLPSTVSYTAYVGCNGYTLSDRELKLLYKSSYTLSTSGDKFYDLVEVNSGEFVSLYYKNGTLPGSSTVSVKAPNGKTGVLNVTKNIGSITISERNSMRPDTSVKVGGSFTVTSTGKYMFWVNSGDTYLDNQSGAYSRSQFIDADFGYTPKSESSSLKLVNYSSSLGFTCINIDSSTPKGTYKLSVAEYPSVTFNVIYK
ncbi:MAG: Ig-like domain-containing protein, partial [Bacteroidales bacterium]|nr:Ig-like domain-containing protein [Bacteroidales bacterium]